MGVSDSQMKRKCTPPDDDSTVPAQAILSELDRPLLCSSAHVAEQDELEIPEAAVLMDSFAGQGLDFVVDAGHEQRVCPQHAQHVNMLGQCWQ